MYVCVCLAVSETEVQSAIEAGATTGVAVTLAGRAGGDCGACHGMILTMLEDHSDEVSGPIVCCPPASAGGGRHVPASALDRPRPA